MFHTEIVIDSDIDSVWQMLIELNNYSKWNPWIIEASGKTLPGSTVTVTAIMNGKPMRATHTILETVPGKRFYWKDSGWNSLFVYGDRCRDLERLPDGKTLLKQTINIVGILSPLVRQIYGNSLQKGIEDESLAIKNKLEVPF